MITFIVQSLYMCKPILILWCLSPSHPPCPLHLFLPFPFEKAPFPLFLRVSFLGTYPATLAKSPTRFSLLKTPFPSLPPHLQLCSRPTWTISRLPVSVPVLLLAALRGSQGRKCGGRRGDSNPEPWSPGPGEAGRRTRRSTLGAGSAWRRTGAGPGAR